MALCCVSRHGHGVTVDRFHRVRAHNVRLFRAVVAVALPLHVGQLLALVVLSQSEILLQAPSTIFFYYILLK